jgi:hypothetical protein
MINPHIHSFVKDKYFKRIRNIQPLSFYADSGFVILVMTEGQVLA